MGPIKNASNFSEFMNMNGGITRDKNQGLAGIGIGRCYLAVILFKIQIKTIQQQSIQQQSINDNNPTTTTIQQRQQSNNDNNPTTTTI